MNAEFGPMKAKELKWRRRRHYLRRVGQPTATADKKIRAEMRARRKH